jgi:multidrug resistance efflux pump
MAKKRFSIHGTKDFLVMAVFCGFLCIWSIRDAWFPSQKVLKKHPPEIPVAFKMSGVVKDIPVKVGQEIAGKTRLASLYDDAHRAIVTEAETVFEAARTTKDPLIEEKQAALMKARADLDAYTVENTDITWTSTHGEETLRGTVTRILVQPATRIEAGVPVLMVKPVDSFYAFNKTLAALSFIGVIIALVFHRIASR